MGCSQGMAFDLFFQFLDMFVIHFNILTQIPRQLPAVVLYLIPNFESLSNRLQDLTRASRVTNGMDFQIAAAQSVGSFPGSRHIRPHGDWCAGMDFIEANRFSTMRALVLLLKFTRCHGCPLGRVLAALEH